MDPFIANDAPTHHETWDDVAEQSLTGYHWPHPALSEENRPTKDSHDEAA